jgi:chromosomal replication initiation ATPase DnaA
LPTAGPGPLLLESPDAALREETLFHLMNRDPAEGGLLITARTAPRTWAISLPDLRSRLNALPVITLAAPDDAVLEGVLTGLFRERSIRPEPELLVYLLTRMERSTEAAVALVERLDTAAHAAGRSVNRSLARAVLEGGPSALDLFD